MQGRNSGRAILRGQYYQTSMYFFPSEGSSNYAVGMSGLSAVLLKVLLLHCSF